MAELIWQAADKNAAGHVATYRCGPAEVRIFGAGVPPSPEGQATSSGAGAPPSPEGKAVPGWVRVAGTLAERRIREYREETGHWPSRELLEEFQRVMGERLQRYIREPLKNPFQPMGLCEFEEKVLRIAQDDSGARDGKVLRSAQDDKGGGTDEKQNDLPAGGDPATQTHISVCRRSFAWNRG